MSLFSSVYRERNAEVRATLDSVRCPSPKRVEEILAHSESSAPLSLADLAELLQIGTTASADSDAQFDLLRAHTRRLWRAPSGNSLRYVSPSTSPATAWMPAPTATSPRGAWTRRAIASRSRAGPRDRLRPGARRTRRRAGLRHDRSTTQTCSSATSPAPSAPSRTSRAAASCSAPSTSPATPTRRWPTPFARHCPVGRDARRASLRRWHSASPRKADFHTRMDNHDRALAAASKSLWSALRLADFRYDALMQVARARYLQKHTDAAPSSWEPRASSPSGQELHLETTVSDRAHETALMVYKLALPQVGRWLQTRETFEMNLRNLLDATSLPTPAAMCSPADTPRSTPPRGRRAVRRQRAGARLRRPRVGHPGLPHRLRLDLPAKARVLAVR